MARIFTLFVETKNSNTNDRSNFISRSKGTNFEFPLPISSYTKKNKLLWITAKRTLVVSIDIRILCFWSNNESEYENLCYFVSGEYCNFSFDSTLYEWRLVLRQVFQNQGNEFGRRFFFGFIQCCFVEQIRFSPLYLSNFFFVYKHLKFEWKSNLIIKPKKRAFKVSGSPKAL